MAFDINNDPITLQQVMHGIVMSRGPINTHAAFVRQGPTSMRSIKKQVFIDAAMALQKLHLGVYNTKIPTGVFLKAHPSTVGKILEENADLCRSVMDYASRFNLLVPSSIGGQRVKVALMADGLLKREQFKQ